MNDRYLCRAQMVDNGGVDIWIFIQYVGEKIYFIGNDK